MSSKKNELSGQEIKKLRDAIIIAFPGKAPLKMMVRIELDKNLDDIAGGDNLQIIVFNLIEWAKSQGQLEELVEAACEGNPGNQNLQDIRKELFPARFSEIIPTVDQNGFVIREKWNELLPVLSSIDLPLLSQICRKTIENLNKNVDIRAHYPELENIGKLSIIKDSLLNSCTPPNTGAKIIVQFVERLSDAVDDSHKRELHKWMIPVAKKYNIKLPTYKKEEFPAKANYYLLVTATAKGNDKFELNAELTLENHSKNGNNETIKISDKLNYEKGIVDCTLSEIATKIKLFIDVCTTSYIKPINNYYSLTIELFMPLYYLDKNIDTQEIKEDLVCTAIGNEYPFVIRSTERIMADSGKHLQKLRDKWDKLYDFLQQKAKSEQLSKIFYYIPPQEGLHKWDWNPYELEKLAYHWGENEDVLGINIIRDFPAENKTKHEFFIYILRTGVPICLWNRCNNIINVDNELRKTFTDKLKTLNGLNALFHSVQTIRNKIYVEEKNKSNYLGLGFLCDNPYRIPLCLNPCLDDSELISSELIPIGE